MAEHERPPKAYMNQRFLEGRDARALRILSEYLEPLARFNRQRVNDTIVFMGSARLLPRDKAEAAVAEAEKSGEGVEKARMALELPPITRRRASSPIASPNGRRRSSSSSIASSSAPAAGRASWKRPIAARPRPKASISG